jgi:hypothetical protein
MKIRKFNENIEHEYHTIICLSEMNEYNTYIFETKEDGISYFLKYIENYLIDFDYENIDKIMEDYISINDLETLIESFDDISVEISDERFYYSTGKVIKPEISKEEFIEIWKLKKDTEKYNL